MAAHIRILTQFPMLTFSHGNTLDILLVATDPMLLLTFSHGNTPEFSHCHTSDILLRHQVKRTSSHSHIDFILSTPAAGNGLKQMFLTIIEMKVRNIVVPPSPYAFHLKHIQSNFYCSPVPAPTVLN